MFYGFYQVFTKEGLWFCKKKHENSWNWPKLVSRSFRTNHHVLRFSGFKPKVSRKWTLWRTMKTHWFGNVSNELPCFKVFIRFSGKSFEKVCYFLKKHLDIDLDKTKNVWNKPQCLRVFIRFSVKSFKKWNIRWRIGFLCFFPW